MAEDAVGVGEHRVRRLAHQGVAEGILVLAGELPLAAARDQLLAGEDRDPVGELGRARRTAEQRRDPARPEDLPEDARRPEHPARVGLLLLEARLRHGEDGVGQVVALAGGDRADQLLEVERVAAGAVDEPRHRLLVYVAERLHDELAGGAPGELAELQLGHGALRPESREEIVDLGARERQHHQRPVVEVAQRRVDELHGGEIAPVQVLEHEQHRLGGALGAEPVLPRAAHLVAHQHRIGAGGLELDAVLVGEGDARELAEELGHALGVVVPEVAADSGEELLAANGGGLAVEHAGGAPDDGAQHPERRAGAHRIAAREEELHRRARGPDAAQQLVAEARLADADRRGDDHGAGDGLGDAFLEGRLEGGELSVATHAGRRLAEQGARRLGGVALGPERERVAVAADLELRVEEAGGDLVDADRARGAGGEQADAALDDVPDRQPRRDHDAPGDHHHRHLGQERPHRQRAPRGARGLVARRAGERHEERAVGDEVERAPEAAGELAQRLGAGVDLAGRERALLGVEAAAAEPRQHQAHHAPLGRGQRGRRDARRRRARARHRTERGERLEHRRRVAGPVGGALRHHPRDQVVEVRGDVVLELREPGHLLERDLEQHREHVVAGERGPAAQALEEDAPEREHVGAGVDLALAARLLGRDVARRAEERAGQRDGALTAAPAGDPEVEDLGPLQIAAREEDVVRLEIAVNDAPPVRDRQRLGHAAPEDERLLDGQALPREPVAEALAVEPLDREIALAVGRHPVGHVAHDPRVRELREELRLAHEAIGVLRAPAVEHLERHRGAGVPVDGAVHRAHPPRSGQALDRELVGYDRAGVHDRKSRTTRPSS